MDDNRILDALARIETAARRIDTAVKSPVLPAHDTAHDPGLALRYEKLRNEAGAALAELDALIGRLGG